MLVKHMILSEPYCCAIIVDLGFRKLGLIFYIATVFNLSKFDYIIPIFRLLCVTIPSNLSKH